MINTPVESKTIVASSVFLDLVGFSKLPTTAQVQAKDQFNTTLRLVLAELGRSDYWVRDLGDGALIICPHSPEHALFVALKVHEEFLARSLLPGLPALKLRIGLNLGVVKTNMDLEGRANFLGDGINATQRVMDFAQPGQILASRSFVDAIAFLHADYADMFLEPQARQDKHGRTHDVYAVQPSLKTLDRLLDEVTPPTKAIPSASRINHDSADVALIPPSVSQTNIKDHSVSIIRDWFIPFNALLFSAGVLWTSFQKFGLSGRPAQLTGLVIVTVGAVLWLISRRSARRVPGGAPQTLSAVGLLLGVVGCMVTTTAWFATTSTEVSAIPQQPVEATLQPQIAAAVTRPPARVTSEPIVPLAAIAVPTATNIKSAPAAPAKVATTPTQRAPENISITAPTQSSGADRNRCALLLNKSALGESISNLEKQEIAQSCR